MHPGEVPPGGGGLEARSMKLSLLPAIAVVACCALAPLARGQYCAAGSASCSYSAADERITRVLFNTLDHSSNFNIQPAGCYSDFTAFSTTLERGTSTPITIEYVNSFSGDR